jgi:hypothetical protein
LRPYRDDLVDRLSIRLGGVGVIWSRSDGHGIASVEPMREARRACRLLMKRTDHSGKIRAMTIKGRHASSAGTFRWSAG